MNDDDESSKAFDDFADRQHSTKIYLRQWKTWQAAVKWARQDERERLARIAESRQADVVTINSRGHGLLFDFEIRRGGVGDGHD